MSQLSCYAAEPESGYLLDVSRVHRDGVTGSASAWILASLAALSLLVAALVGCRIVYTDTFDHTAILWNLALAWVPLGLAVLVSHQAAGGTSLRVFAAAALWLVFLPNAPYMVTDVKYVGAGGRVPVLYDALLFSAAAWTGLLLGFTSLFLMHAVARRFCSMATAWALVVGALALSSFGVYLGRVPRANSWDLFLHPASLGTAAAQGLRDPRAILLTVLLTAFLSAGYLAVYSLGAKASTVWTTVVERREVPAVAAPSKPRILMLATLAEVGGAQASVSHLLPALTREFDVTVAAHGSGLLRETAEEAGIPFVPLDHLRRDIHPWHDMLALVELVRLFRRARPDVVHLHSSKAGILGRLAAVLARVPIRVFTVHGWSFAAYRGSPGRLFLWAERMVRPITTAVICVSHASREQGIAARACIAGRTVVIHNAVDTTSFLPARRTEGPPRIISVARFAFPKDFATLVRALALVSADYRATFVGDGPALPDIATVVEMQGLEGKVELLSARGDVRELLASSEIFVLSSRSEGHPVSLLEAMAAGLPVVATDVGGVAESVVHGQTGMLVPAGNVAALASALERLAEDEHLRRRLGAAGRARARELFGLSRFRSSHLALYQRELERARRAPAEKPVAAPGGRLGRHVLSVSGKPGE
jgi:glycosyltransferase involved in cell wall biosynthesis/uncharacterized membrane protein